MKISSEIPQIYTKQAVVTVKQVNDSDKPPVQVQSGGERVEISSQAQEISRAIVDANKIPDVDLKKVAKVKTMIENGTYRIDSRKIASTMVAEALLSDL